MRKLLFLLLPLVLLGCSYNPGKNPEPVPISARVTQANRAVSGVTLNLQPTGSGTQAALPVKNGGVKGPVTPGKYTWYISEGSSAATYRAVPAKYREGAMDRQIDVEAGRDLVFKLD